MGVALSDLDTGMPGQFLGKFKISRGAQDCGDKIVAKGMRGNMTFRLVAEGLTDTFANDIPACRRGNSFNFFSRTLIVAGKEGEGREGATGTAIQNSPS